MLSQLVKVALAQLAVSYIPVARPGHEPLTYDGFTQGGGKGGAPRGIEHFSRFPRVTFPILEYPLYVKIPPLRVGNVV